LLLCRCGLRQAVQREEYAAPMDDVASGRMVSFFWPSAFMDASPITLPASSSEHCSTLPRSWRIRSPTTQSGTIYMRQVRHVWRQGLSVVTLFALAFLAEGNSGPACRMPSHGFLCSQNRAPWFRRAWRRQSPMTRSESCVFRRSVDGHDDGSVWQGVAPTRDRLRCRAGKLLFRAQSPLRFVVTTAGGHGADVGLWNHRRSRRT